MHLTLVVCGMCWASMDPRRLTLSLFMFSIIMVFISASFTIFRTLIHPLNVRYPYGPLLYTTSSIHLVPLSALPASLAIC